MKKKRWEDILIMYVQYFKPNYLLWVCIKTDLMILGYILKEVSQWIESFIMTADIQQKLICV